MSIWTLLGICVAEVVISTTTGSLTLFADGLDSMADALVSFIVWFGITMLHKPKSRLFHFGYAKIESFAAFIAAVVIVVLGAFRVYHAYERILHPTHITNPEITMITLVAAGSISLHRAFRVRAIVKKYTFVSLLTLDKSISGLTALISPIFTRRSYLLLTVGVLTFISREIARNDFLPSSINDFRIATSVSSSSTGNVLCQLVYTAIM